eukprot:366086-Chlamydomonas_euryale.AAC.5
MACSWIRTSMLVDSHVDARGFARRCLWIRTSMLVDSHVDARGFARRCNASVVPVRRRCMTRGVAARAAPQQRRQEGVLLGQASAPSHGTSCEAHAHSPAAAGRVPAVPAACDRCRVCSPSYLVLQLLSVLILKAPMLLLLALPLALR